MEKEEEGSLIKAHGLSLLVAGVFLAGEMAGSGVLALPHAMVGTGRTTSCLFFKYIFKRVKIQTGPGGLLKRFFAIVFFLQMLKLW